MRSSVQKKFRRRFSAISAIFHQKFKSASFINTHDVSSLLISFLPLSIPIQNVNTDKKKKNQAGLKLARAANVKRSNQGRLKWRSSFSVGSNNHSCIQRHKFPLYCLLGYFLACCISEIIYASRNIDPAVCDVGCPDQDR